MRRVPKKNPLIPISFIFLLFVGAYFYVFYFSSNHFSKNMPKPLSGKISSNKDTVTFDLLSKMKKNEVILSFAGDCTIGTDPNFSYNTFDQKYKEVNNDPSYFFSNMKPIFSSDDLTIVNFEGTLTDSNRRAQKKFTFKGPPEYAKILSSGSIELVNLANNHTYDFLETGYKDTLNSLYAEEISYFGLGQVYKTSINNIPMAFLGYKGWLENINISHMEEHIKELKKEGYVVFVSFHWGIEGRYMPTSAQKTVGHKAIDSGADFVIGHHPHVVEGFEIYKDRLIAYSLGNFCFGGNSNPKDKRTMVVQVKLMKNTENTYSSYFRVLPAKISSIDTLNDFKPTLMSKKEDIDSFFEFINNISPDMGFEISNDFTSIWSTLAHEK